MPAPAPLRALCLRCCSIRDALEFQKVLAMNTAGMITIRYQETVETKNNDGKVLKTEQLWNSKLNEQDKLQPIHFGAGACEICREEAVEINGKMFLPMDPILVKVETSSKS